MLLISKFAQYYGRIVKLEDNEAVIKLDTRELTIRVISERGLSAWLYQIGSGANYLGYHVAMMLALHEFFITRPIPYVPSLLILDQPSQTQFPDDLDEEAEQEELLAVHQAFEACDGAIERTKKGLQIIVSEHAGLKAYAGISNLTVVDKWRRGRKLIPWHWDVEALGKLEGQAADWALQDLSDAVLKPAIAAAFGLSGAAEVSTIQIDHATFTGFRLTFLVRAAISIRNSSEEIDDVDRVSVEEQLHIVKGSIGRDLTVDIPEIQTIADRTENPGKA